MWIGNRSTRYLLVFNLVLLVACAAEEQPTVGFENPQAAWWYDIELQPKSDAIQGIDVKAIDERWRRVQGLQSQDLDDQVSQDDIEGFIASPLSFRLSADLDDDGVAEDFLVGVFEASDATRGRFVLITKNGNPVQHFTETGSAGFSALLEGEAEVRWYKCMECGEFESIRWTGQTYVLE